MEPRSTSRSTRKRGRPAAAHGRGRTSEASTAEGRTEPLVVARILGPHGIRGEVRLDPRTDVPERLSPGATLECDGVGMLTIESVRGEASSPIVHFAGYDSRDAASVLKDRFLRVSLEEARRATKGAYLWADLVGLEGVTPEGRVLGTVRDLIRAGEADVLVVVDEQGHELLLPMLESVVRAVDVAGGRIVLAPQEHLP